MVKMTFPARPNLPMMAMPEVEVTWYDGGFRGEIPDLLPDGKTWQGEGYAIYGSAAGTTGGPGGFGGAAGKNPASVNAREYMASLVSHPYLNGFSLPAMSA